MFKKVKQYCLNTFLLKAYRRNKWKLVKFLIKLGADPNANDGMLLMHAVLNEDIKMLRYLLSHGGYPGTNSKMLLTQVIKYGNITMLEDLLDYGLNPDDGISLAILLGDDDIICILIDYGADPNIDGGYALAMLKSIQGNSDLVEFIEEMGGREMEVWY